MQVGGREAICSFYFEGHIHMVVFRQRPEGSKRVSHPDIREKEYFNNGEIAHAKALRWEHNVSILGTPRDTPTSVH